ncbi:hypothetical protein C3489_05410 [Streptomyces sp. Ru71]|uniref:hypothetical protein n=1 Tax=Streptomyces sp. Ru71 TaxID=2080746 RepID=UPI000CDE2CAA|nr:hypothetical protein [Streptomyces sp. Ru71]POX56482.1 hypothetical protein C3489_05410 [Streptomyces sp. Ru71]
MTAGWCTRTVRAAVFAAVCVLLAALGHVLMSGRDVPAWALAGGAAGTAAAGWCLAGRERGLPAIVAVVVATQALLHEAFELAQSAAGGTAVPMGSTHMSHMGMDHMAAMVHAGTAHMAMGQTSMSPLHMSQMSMPPLHMSHTGMPGVPGMDMGAMGHSMTGSSSFGMFAAHLLAALLCGLWLAYGERAAFRILRAVAGRLAAPLRLLLALPVTAHRPRLTPRRPRSDRAPRLLLLVHAITSRGPPLGTAVA